MTLVRPGFPARCISQFACAAFCKESRMKFAGTTKLDRKSGEHGAPAVHAQEVYGTAEAVPFVEASCT